MITYTYWCKTCGSDDTLDERGGRLHCTCDLNAADIWVQASEGKYSDKPYSMDEIEGSARA